MAGIDVTGSLGDAVRAYGQHAGKLIALGAVFAGPLTVATLLVRRAAQDVEATGTAFTGSMAVAWLSMFVASIGAVVLAGAVYRMMSLFRALEPIDLGAALAHSVRRTPAQLGAGVVATLVGAAAMAVCVGPMAVAASLSDTGRVGGWSVVLIVPLILFGVWAGLAAMLVQPAVVAGYGPVASLRRALDLAKGHRWALFGALLITAVVSSIPADLLSYAVTAVMESRGAGMSTTFNAVVVASVTLPAIFISPFVACFAGLIYESAAQAHDAGDEPGEFIGRGDLGA